MAKINNTISSLTVTLLCFLIHINALAGEHITFDAHVHGLSEINIAIDQQTIEIGMKSPAIDLVGFEHKAKSKEDITAVKKAKSLLNRHDRVIEFSGGNCELLNQFIDVSSIIHTHHHTENEHTKQHIKNYSQEVNHSEVIANYRYHCKKVADLYSITVKVFHLFPGIKKMQALWITEREQGAASLNPKNKVINLR